MDVLSRLIMGWSDWYPMNKDAINKIPEKPGVYQLNSNSETLYHGQSNDLRRRLLEHLNSLDSCIQKATNFCYQESDDPEGLESRILKNFRDNHGGNLPPCNEQS